MSQWYWSLSALGGLCLCSAVAADAENGEVLHEDHCVSCHLMDDHSALYTRQDRVVDSLHRLGGQVSACTQVLNVSWFPEEERDVVEFLNTLYYQFPQ
jgi:hypothetical protein